MQNENTEAQSTSHSESDARDARLAEATSSETLSDVHAETKLTGKDSTADEVGSMPAPDGDSTTTGTPERADGGAGELL